MYWTTLCFSFDDQNGAPIKKKRKKEKSQFDTLTETHCVGKWPSERRGMSSEVLLQEKVSTLRKESEALVKRSLMDKFVPSSKMIIKCQDLPEECATKRSRSLKRTSVSDVFFFYLPFFNDMRIIKQCKILFEIFFSGNILTILTKYF